MNERIIFMKQRIEIEIYIQNYWWEFEYVGKLLIFCQLNEQNRETKKKEYNIMKMIDQRVINN